jgi:hypothetical protein
MKTRFLVTLALAAGGLLGVAACRQSDLAGRRGWDAFLPVQRQNSISE